MPVQVLAERGGLASWDDLRRAGVTSHALWRAVAAGAVHRLRRGTYCLPTLDPALQRSLELGGVLSCASAAVALGLPVLTAHGPHVVVPRCRKLRQPPGVPTHRRDLLPDEKSRAQPTTSLLRTVVDCAREIPLRDALVIADAALRAGLCSADLRTAAASARGPGSASIRAVADRADGRSESPIESCLRLLAQPLAGTLDLQVWIDGVGRVDMVLDGWLVVEADGFEHHSGREEYRNDRRRLNALAMAGYELLRFSYEDIVHNPAYVLDTLRRVLARGPR